MKKILLIISITFVLFLAGCNNNENVNNNVLENNKDNNGGKIDNEMNTEQNEDIDNTKTVKKVYEDKDLVYTILDVKNGNYGMNVKVPYINLDTQVAKEINDKLTTFVNQISGELGEKEKVFEYNDRNGVLGTTYEWYLNDNILSIIIKLYDVGHDGAFVDSINNFDVYTGEELNSRDLLDYKLISEQELINDLKDYDIIGEITSVDEISMYLDVGKNLHILVETESIAGPTSIIKDIIIN